jgi:hypothetical protein
MTAQPAARGRSLVAPPDRARDLVLTLLAIAAGCIDAVSFLGLGQVLTAAMTGNTVLLGLAVGQADVAAALRSAVALCGFFAGTLIGASIVERGPGPIWSPAVAAALAVELAILVALMIAPRRPAATAGLPTGSRRSPPPHWRWVYRAPWPIGPASPASRRPTSPAP